MRLNLRRVETDEAEGGEEEAILERVRIGNRRAFALVLPETFVERLRLNPGDTFALETDVPRSWPVEFKYAVDAVTKHLQLDDDYLVAERPVGLLNTPEGEREFWRARTATPDLPTATCRQGLLVKAGTMDFVYLNPDIWESGEGIVPASVHMLLHALQPEAEEDQIRGAEADVCEQLSTAPRRPPRRRA